MSFIAAAPVEAQTPFTFVNGGSVSAFGYMVGPYNGVSGTGADAENVTLNCVDFFHEISIGQQWNANLTNLGTGLVGGTNTRFGDLGLYQQAAYLTTQYAGQSNFQIGQIQATIWNLFSNATSATPSSDYWLKQAQTNYTTMDYSDFWVVTDVNAFSPDANVRTASAQEFVMHTTPEPATFVLLGTGLAGLIGVTKLRRKGSRIDA